MIAQCNRIITKQNLQSLLVVISTLLLLKGPLSTVEWCLLIIISFSFIKTPVNYIPLIFITSLSFTITVIPGFAGFFYYLTLFFLSLIIKGKAASRQKKISVYLILYAVWMLYTSANSISGNSYNALKTLCIIILVLLSLRYTIDNVRLKRNLIIVAIFTISFSTIRMLFFPTYYIPEAVEGMVLYSDEYLQLTFLSNINPNTAAQSILILYIILLIEILNNRKYFLIIFAVQAIFLLILIGSRTAFFGLLFITLIVLFYSLRISLSKKILSLCFIFLIGYNVMTYLYNNIYSRIFVSSIFEDGGSGRFSTWTTFFKDVIPNYLIQGIGYGRENLIELGYYFDADNMYVDILCQMGIVGFILLFLLLITLTINLYNGICRSKICDTAFAFMLFVYIDGFGETLFDSMLFWFIILYCGLIINTYRTTIKTESCTKLRSTQNLTLWKRSYIS